MRKYFVFSDVHGFYHELSTALYVAGFEKDNPEHFIISCGDACDRGPQAKLVLEFLLDMYNAGRAILIRGNHEDLMEEAIARHCFMNHDIHNGTDGTAMQLTGLCEDYEALQAMRTNELWNSYISKCVDYAELGDYIFVHGWIPVTHCASEEEQYKDLPLIYRPTDKRYNPNWRKPLWGDDWKEARWLNGMNMWFKGIREPNKTIVCGHYHTSWGHSRLHDDGREWLSSIETYYIDPETGKQEPHANFEPFYDDGIIAIDACTAHTKHVNVITLEI